jgi:hypothetical protein
MTESQLQSKCVTLYADAYPENRGRLFATFQETTSKAQGGLMLSKGLIPGVSDLLYSNANRYLVGIEMKAPGTYHDLIHVLEQCLWIKKSCYNGGFCTSVEEFMKIIESDGNYVSISVEEVVGICANKLKCQYTTNIEEMLTIAHNKKKQRVKF